MELESISIKELEQMMETSDMKQFCAIAKVLVQKNSKDAYEVLKKYVFSSDIYQRRQRWSCTKVCYKASN